MEYRTLGRTGLRVSAIGLGTEYLHEQTREVVIEVVAEAIDRGVNYLDIIFSFPEYLDNLGAALAGRRDRVFLALHVSCAETDGQYRRTRDINECTRNFHDMLQRLKTDHADVLVVQNCDEQEDYNEIMTEGGVLDLAERFRREGKCRFLGFSGHSPAIPTQAVQSSRFDVLMTSIHLREAGSDQRKLYRLCAQENIGLVGMKPFAGGGLLQPQEGQIMATPVQCLSYVLSQPGVCTTVPGMKSVEELHAELRYFEATPEERDYSSFIIAAGWNAAGACTYCNHCTPCTQGISIGQTLRLLDLASHGISVSLHEAYLSLPGAPASACIACGKCRERCPFGVDTTERIRQAAAAFETRERR